MVTKFRRAAVSFPFEEDIEEVSWNE